MTLAYFLAQEIGHAQSVRLIRVSCQIEIFGFDSSP